MSDQLTIIREVCAKHGFQSRQLADDLAAALSCAPTGVMEDCEVDVYSSGVCERGTKGCTAQHAAANPAASAQPVGRPVSKASNCTEAVGAIYAIRKDKRVAVEWFKAPGPIGTKIYVIPPPAPSDAHPPWCSGGCCNELTDAQCDEFRRLPLSFNDMVRAIHRAGASSKEQGK